MNKLKMIAKLIVLSLLGACSQLPETDGNTMMTELDGPLAQLQVDTRQLYQRLEKLTTDKSCQSEKSCQVIGIGARACGGPEQFLVYSSDNTDQRMLAITNDRYVKLKKEQQKRLGNYSTCQILNTPAAACVARQCVLVE